MPLILPIPRPGSHSPATTDTYTHTLTRPPYVHVYRRVFTAGGHGTPSVGRAVTMDCTAASSRSFFVIVSVYDRPVSATRSSRNYPLNKLTAHLQSRLSTTACHPAARAGTCVGGQIRK